MQNVLYLAREVFAAASSKLLDKNLSETQAASLVTAVLCSTTYLLKHAEFLSIGQHRTEDHDGSKLKPQSSRHYDDEMVGRIGRMSLETLSDELARCRDDLMEEIAEEPGRWDDGDLWLGCFEAFCREVFRIGLGSQVAFHLSKVAPKQCASWLGCVKNLALASQFTSDRILAEMHRDLEGEKQEKYRFSVTQEEREKYWRSMISLKWIWPGLKGFGGISSKQWQTRLAAVQLVSVMFDINGLDDELARQICKGLLYQLALFDVHWQVRRDAIKCGAKVFIGLKIHGREFKFDDLIWGFLAASLDKQPEVSNMAVESLVNFGFTPETHSCQEIFVRLLDKFVAKVVLMNSSEISGPTYSADMGLHLAAMNGAIHLDWLGISQERLIPLIVALLAWLSNNAKRSGDRSIFDKVSEILRILASKHEDSVVGMISSAGPNYSGASLTRFYEALGILDDEAADMLEGVKSTTILQGVLTALESIDHRNAFPLVSKQKEDNFQLQRTQVHALLHIVEMLEIPSSLVSVAKDTLDTNEVEKFSEKCLYFLEMADIIINNMCWLEEAGMEKSALTQGLVLTCATMASVEEDTETPLLWVNRSIQELAVRIVNSLGTVFKRCGVKKLVIQEPNGSRSLVVDNCDDIEILVMYMLPVFLPKFKEHLRSYLGLGEQRDTISHAGASLTSAILAAHQMYWCIKQVKHPHLGLFCSLIIPCSLTALDHYSAYVKRQATKVLIHMANNLNASELRWYKEPLLDSVCRSVIGSGDMWPLVVVMSIRLVICIEGRNPRGRWYRSLFNEMLGELERHQNDRKWCASWLEHSRDLVEAMGLVLVAHFKRLLPLLFLWLQSPDDTVCLLVLNMLSTIVRNTWPRMPSHAERMWLELVSAYKASFQKPSGALVRASIIDLCRLLKSCGGPAFKTVMIESQNDEQMDSLCRSIEAGSVPEYGHGS